VPEGAASTLPPSFVDTIPVDEAAVEAGEGERDGRRRRRRRGGRRDDAGSDSAMQPNDGREATPGVGEAAASMSPTATDVVRETAPREGTATRERERPWREERGAAPAGDSATLPPGAAALPAAGEASTAAAAAPTPRIVPPVPHFELPTHALEQLADGAGLQWVQSDADKVRTVQEAIAAEPPPAHVPRERKPMALADDGPLVLVETRKDLSQLGLPFERQAEARAQPLQP
jgi:ribonuclease E